MEHLFDTLEKEFEGIAIEEGGIVVIDTNSWMRPTTAVKKLQERGLDVSKSLMSYWQQDDKIETIEMDKLGSLTLVNINTIRNDLLERLKVKRDKNL